MKKYYDKVMDNFENWACILLLVLILICVCLQVVSRVLFFSVTWTEELSRYCFIWLSFLATVQAIKPKKHLKVDVLSIVVGKRGQLALDLFSDMVTLLFWIFICIVSVPVIQHMSLMIQKSAVMGMDMRVLYIAPVVCGVFSTLRYAESIYNTIHNYRNAGYQCAEEKRREN